MERYEVMSILRTQWLEALDLAREAYEMKDTKNEDYWMAVADGLNNAMTAIEREWKS